MPTPVASSTQRYARWVWRARVFEDAIRFGVISNAPVRSALSFYPGRPPEPAAQQRDNGRQDEATHDERVDKQATPTVTPIWATLSTVLAVRANMVIPKTIPAVVTTPPVAGERADDAGAQAGAGLFANLHGQQQIVVGPDSHERRAGDLGGPSVHQVSLQLGTGSLFREPHLARAWPHGQPFDHRLGRHPAVEIATGVLAKRRAALDIAHVIHDLEGEGELVGVTRQGAQPVVVDANHGGTDGASPQDGIVTDIVVHERCLVEHLHRAGQVDGIGQRHGGRGQQVGACQHQAGPGAARIWR